MGGSLMLVWDVLFSEKAVMDKTIPKEVTSAMEKHCEGMLINSAMRWNTVLGGSVSRQGFTSGIRIVIGIDGVDEIEIHQFVDNINQFNHPHMTWSQLRLAEKLNAPLDIKTKKRFPLQGRIALFVEFTNGLGYETAKAINSAKSNQTKDTKNSLDPTNIEGRGANGKLFSSEFRSIMQDSNWFTLHPTPEDAISKKESFGGMYELMFDLTSIVDKLSSLSEDIWWKKIDSSEISLNPHLFVVTEVHIDSPLDPSSWIHQNKNNFEKKLKEVLEWEKRQSDSNAEIVEEIKYISSRITRGRRPSSSLTKEQGLVQGLEEHCIKKFVLQPWVALEFVNCLNFFLLTQKPSYWRNTKAKIWLFHEFNAENLSMII